MTQNTSSTVMLQRRERSLVFLTIVYEDDKWSLEVPAHQNDGCSDSTKIPEGQSFALFYKYLSPIAFLGAKEFRSEDKPITGAKERKKVGFDAEGSTMKDHDHEHLLSEMEHRNVRKDHSQDRFFSLSMLIGLAIVAVCIGVMLNTKGF